MSQKTKKQAEGKRDYKIFTTTDDEKHSIRQALATIGYFNVAIEGLQFKLQYEQAKIEKRVNVGKAKEGFRIQTMIDPETLNLFAREIPLPKAEDKKEEE